MDDEIVIRQHLPVNVAVMFVSWLGARVAIRR